VRAADHFDPEPGLAYLDSATYGLPPRETVQALTGFIDQWQHGTGRWIEDWDVVAEDARRSFARLVEVPVETVALIPAASVGVGTVAASLSDDDGVVLPDDDFTSLMFPLLSAEQRRGTTVRQVPFDGLATAVDESTTHVATSLVQMQTGRVADLDGLLATTRSAGARLLLDATHGLPFVGRGVLDTVDYVVCAAYKHLLCPRGVAFMIVRPDRLDELATFNANWRAASDPYGRYFGGPLDLAGSAGRFDVSVGWMDWVGASVSLSLLTEWAGAGELVRPLQMARELAERLGVEWGGSSIVCAPVMDIEPTQAALVQAGIRAGFRGPNIRLSTHVYTTDEDLDRVVDTVVPFLG